MYTGNPILDSELSKFNKAIVEINKRIDSLQLMFSKTVYISDLRILQRELNDKIQSNNTLVATLESKLNMIKTPEETRYYLEESEVSDFRNNFTKLLTMIADVNDTFTQLSTYMSSQ